MNPALSTSASTVGLSALEQIPDACLEVVDAVEHPSGAIGSRNPSGDGPDAACSCLSVRGGGNSHPTWKRRCKGLPEAGRYMNGDMRVDAQLRCMFKDPNRRKQKVSP